MSETTEDVVLEEETVFTTTGDVESTSEWFVSIDRYVLAPLRIVMNDIRGILGGGIILFYTLMGTVGVVLVEPPEPYSGPALLPPFKNWKFPLGTDNLGESLLAQIVHATPAMFQMMIGGAVFTVVVGTVVGVYAGLVGGVTDRVLSTLIDITMTIPGLPLIIVVSVLFEPRRPLVVGIILSINAWAGLARSLRSEVLSIREESYVEAARVLGISTRNIILVDVLPNVMSYITINFVNSARRVIFNSIGLYFLGILPFTVLNWGVIMNLAYRTGSALSTLKTFYWFAIPTVTVVLLSVGLVLFAQSLDQVFNPRVRARHAATIEEGGPESTQT